MSSSEQVKKKICQHEKNKKKIWELILLNMNCVPWTSSALCVTAALTLNAIQNTKKFGINGCAFFYSVCARTRRRLIIKRGTAPFIYLFFIFLLFSYFVDAVKRRITPLSLPIGFFFLCILLGPVLCVVRE